MEVFDAACRCSNFSVLFGLPYEPGVFFHLRSRMPYKIIECFVEGYSMLFVKVCFSLYDEWNYE